MTLLTNPVAANDAQEIEAALKTYWQAADSRDVVSLDRVFHEDYQVVALTKNGKRVMGKADYLDLMRAGKIGGTARRFDLSNLTVSGSIAQSLVLLTGETATFHDHITLMRDTGEWKIYVNVTEVIPNE